MNINKQFNNRVRLRMLDACGIQQSQIILQNTLTYAASDVMINALLRSGPSQVSHLYARFGGVGSNTAWVSTLDGDLRSVTRSDFLLSSDEVRGGLWVPLLSAPSQESTDTNFYAGNKATFFFRIPANLDPAQMSPANFDAETSGIYSLGLAVAANTIDRTQDIIISILQIPSDDLAKAIVPVGGQLAIDYPLEHTTEVKA